MSNATITTAAIIPPIRGQLIAAGGSGAGAGGSGAGGSGAGGASVGGVGGGGGAITGAGTAGGGGAGAGGGGGAAAIRAKQVKWLTEAVTVWVTGLTVDDSSTHSSAV